MWAQEHNSRITVNVRESIIAIEGTVVNIEELERKIPELLKQKIYETVDLTKLARLSSFDKSFIPIIMKLTQTYIQPLGENSVSLPTTFIKSIARYLLQFDYSTTYLP